MLPAAISIQSILATSNTSRDVGDNSSFLIPSPSSDEDGLRHNRSRPPQSGRNRTSRRSLFYRVGHDQPRNPKESLFAGDGYPITFGYGALIGIATLIAFLIKPWAAVGFDLGAINQYFAVKDSLGVYTNLEEAQSMAFCVLSFSELFHMGSLSLFGNRTITGLPFYDRLPTNTELYLHRTLPLTTNRCYSDNQI